MQLSGTTYEQVLASFRWHIPAAFNIATAIADRHAATRPADPAILFETSDGALTTLTFQALAEAGSRLANALAGLGVRRGEVVAINLPQGVESPIAHVAVQKLGAVALPLFNLFGPDAIRYRLADSGAVALITSIESFARLDGALADVPSLRETIVVGAPDGTAPRSFWPTLEAGAATIETAATGADDPALLMYTSGTTGQPKGVLHAGRVLLGHLPGVIVPHELFPQAGDRFWTPADWAWAGGLLDVLWPSLYFGVPVAASARAKFDPDWAFAFMARHNVRNVFMPPTALRLMRQARPAPRPDGPRLRSLGTGGETLGADMLDWGEAVLGVSLCEFFGQTEANLVVGNGTKLFPIRPGSMGRAIPGHVVEVVDDAGSVMPPGTPGIVAVRRPDPVMLLEYWRRPEATAAKFRGDWCLLGDIAVKDAEGYLWFQGRDDDIINSAGYRIGPGEVEECLAAHPAVALAGVVGAPDPIRGEVVAAFLVVKPGVAASAGLAEEIKTFVRTRLAAHEYPRQIHFLDEMPMTVTGKIRRVDLRAMTRPATEEYGAGTRKPPRS